MKKEVLFRGIRIDNGNFAEGLPHYNAVECCLQITEFVQTFPSMSDPCGDQFNLWHNIKPETLGEFTSRFDAQVDGQKVFEDDIILNADTKDLQVVYWNDDKAAWYCRYVSDPQRIVSLADSLGNLNKKVGDIWNNPELINEAEGNDVNHVLGTSTLDEKQPYCTDCGNDKLLYLDQYANGEYWKCKECGKEFIW